MLILPLWRPGHLSQRTCNQHERPFEEPDNSTMSRIRSVMVC